MPNVVQIHAAAYADNLSIDPSISAGHRVYLRAECQPSGEDSWSAQTQHHKTVALYDNLAWQYDICIEYTECNRKPN